MLVSVTIDGCLNCGVQELHDQYCEADGYQYRTLYCAPAQPQRDGQQDEGEKHLLAECRFVPPRMIEALGRIRGRTDNAA